MNLSTHKKSEVELRVAQEIKNHQEWQYNVGQSLLNLGDQILSLSKRIEGDMAKNVSDRTSVQIGFENLKEEIVSEVKQINQRLGDVESKLFELLQDFIDLRDRVELEYLTRGDFITALAPEVRKIDLVERELTLKADYFNLAVHSVRQQFKDHIEQVKKDLTPVVPEVDPVDTKLNERFKVFKVDFDGLMKEIAVIKNNVAYGEKKFENIYTQIARLKEGK